METTAIVLSTERTDYRKVAQASWGLTDEQMKGMHVHHHPPRSQGGRNIPEHLYVCSPSMHAYGWHNEEEFVEFAEIGRLKGLETRRLNKKPPKTVETPEQKSTRVALWNAARAGEKRSSETRRNMSVSHINSLKSKTNIREQNTRQWVDPMHPELGVRTISALARMQKKRGYPYGPENRVKVT